MHVDFVEPRLQITFEQVEPLELLEQRLVGESDRAHVDADGALDSAAAGVLHPAPIAASVGDQFRRRDAHHRLVEILHLHRRERHVDHIAVDAVALHLDPVALAHRVVRGDLDSGHQAHDSVLEHKQEPHDHRTQAGHQRAYLAPHHDRDDEHTPDKTCHQHRRLQQALDRHAF